MTNNRKTFVNQLIQAGKEEAKNVQEIKSVATPKEETIQATVDTEFVSEAIKEADAVSLGKKGLAILFSSREVKDSEAVKIPRELHKELKMLSTMSGVSMIQMLGNLIEYFFNENQKEITNYRRKFLK